MPILPFCAGAQCALLDIHSSTANKSVALESSPIQYHGAAQNVRALRQAFAGIVTVSVGHCHPRVVAAINAQNARLQHTTTIYLHHQIAEYGRELTARLPGDLKARAVLCAPGRGLFSALELFHDTA